MKITLVTDAWHPQVNGVVTTLVALVQQLAQMGHEVNVIHPSLFPTFPCPGYPGIDLAWRPQRRMDELLQTQRPESLHIATEGPLGWAARRYALRHGWAFTTAYHTRFPEILRAALRVPLRWGYAWFRHFHRPSAGVMVPTQGVLELLQARGFKALKPWTHGVDTQVFRPDVGAAPGPLVGALAHPVSLFVGRISYEKNIEAFLSMDIPGTKLVCGVGPLEESLKQRFPQVRWLGVLPRDELAQVYASADVFVFPGRAETFGLVMLEAMACGTPVAAYPVEGPLEVLGAHARSGQTPTPGPRPGVLSEDLSLAWREALTIPRWQARQRALQFSWQSSAQLFVSHLQPVRAVPAKSTASTLWQRVWAEAKDR